LVKFLRQVFIQSMLACGFAKSPPLQASSRSAATRVNSRGTIWRVRVESACACRSRARAVASQSLLLAGAATPKDGTASAVARQTARCARLTRTETYGAALGLMPIDCAAAAYQLVDLKTATRRAGLRLRALTVRVACDPRVLADAARLAARLVRSFLRMDNLPALNRRIGARLDPAP
jgi:hypothetical protein